MFDWLSGFLSVRHILWGALFFVLSSLGGLALAGVFIVNMPDDYFVGSRHPKPDRRGGIHGWTAHILKNLAGLLLAILGLILALPGVPGPGFVTILIGLMLMDFPGKHRLERWLVMRPGVLAAMNRLRCRYGKSPMRLEGPNDGAD